MKFRLKQRRPIPLALGENLNKKLLKQKTMKQKINAKELRALGYPESPIIPVAMDVVNKHYKHSTMEDISILLVQVLESPADFLTHEFLYKIAERLVEKTENEMTTVSLNKEGVPFTIFGAEHIEQGAFHQMYQAAKLPISVAGALMPDAHHGYGLPIGGVLATEGAVIPYGVGVDIGCRMCLSIFDLPSTDLTKRSDFFERELQANTLFGSGAQFKQAHDHEIMENKLFDELDLLKSLQGRAWRQLGSSGSGNHFVEFGVVSIKEKDEILGIEKGEYIGLLSHSGSRALGAHIANHYTKVAKQKRRMPQEVNHLAWLNLNESEGMEYWLAMNLAGDYASACHHIIHEKMAKQLGRKPLRRVENHHNFAWKEILNGKEVIVHRKGATPAGKNVLGIIPGSMTANGYIVKGKGEQSAIHSASHGAGRKMSRTQAENSITHKALRDELSKHKVTLFGGGLDEAPFAYKDIETVMKSQTSLVDIIGAFTPKIVKMAGPETPIWKKKKGAEPSDL